MASDSVAQRGPRRRREWTARLLTVLLVLGLPLLALAAGRSPVDVVTLHATMPEAGGWQPGHIIAEAGQPLHLRLTSDDVVHSFAVGVAPDGTPTNLPEVEVYPGQMTELTLNFDQIGTYTFVCTRWCGPNHWRMRGTIEVRGDAGTLPPPAVQLPLYLQLGLDVDAPHPAAVIPESTPSASRGAALVVDYPVEFLERQSYMTQSPVDVWFALRESPELAHLDDGALWDAVAALWKRQSTPETLARGAELYSQNCAACHGESGAGDGVFAQTGPDSSTGMRGHTVEAATDFTDPALLAASNALLQGKIIRGGMGTGMPAWGALFTEAELQALLDYLWTFQFPAEDA